MKWCVWLFGVLVTTSNASESCLNCHLPEGVRVAPLGRTPPGDAKCARCHVALRDTPDASWLPFGDRARATEAYRHIPALDGGRYTDCGLERYLRAPVPRRHGARESMFPTDAKLAGVAPCPNARPELVEGGRALFAKHCASCHASGPGPRLRIGVPLLARAYFGRTVREGSAGRVVFEWIKGRRQPTARMPAFRLDDREVESLYAYVSVDASDVPPTSQGAADNLYGLELFRAVQTRVFQTSCRHCHSGDRGIIRDVVGGLPAELPILNARDTPELRRALRELGPRLRARQQEWSGRPGAVRGMPLTQAPLPEETIQLVERWVRGGCPSDVGALCP